MLLGQALYLSYGRCIRWLKLSGKTERAQLTARRSNSGPIVRSKRRSRQSGYVVKIRDRVVGPSVTNRHWLLDRRTRDDHGMAVDARVSPDKTMIVAGDCKACEWTIAARFQSGAIFEMNPHLVAFNGVAIEKRSGWNYLLAIGAREGPSRQAATDIKFVFRMEIDLIADIDNYRHSGLRLTQRHSLRLTQLSPVTLVRLRFACAPVSELHEIKRKVATPRTAPITNHDWKERAVLIGASGVAFALIPNRAAN